MGWAASVDSHAPAANPYGARVIIRAHAETFFAREDLDLARRVLALHLHYRGVFDAAAGPEDPYLRAIAEHLEASGAVFYGAYW